MTAHDDLERDVRVWLEADGPQDVPDRVLEPAIATAVGQSRNRPLPSIMLSAIDAVEAVSVARQVRTTRVWAAIALLLVLTLTVALLAGAYLFTTERLTTNGSIGFVIDGDIWLYDPFDDEAPRNWTGTFDLVESGPVWSPDGSNVAYWVTDPSDSTAHIVVRGWPHGPITRLTDRDGLILKADDEVVGWSPDGTRLLAPAVGISQDGGSIVSEVVVVFDIASHEVERVSGDERAWSFGWSPDGRHIGLVIDDTIALHDVETGQTRSISDALPPGAVGRQHIQPVFSEDGNSVIYSTAELWTDRSDIRSVTLDGDVGDITIARDRTDLAVAVAPRGGRIAYASSLAASVGAATSGVGTSDIGGAIIVRQADGSETPVAEDVWPMAAWSPDGERLVTRSVDGTELIIIDIERPLHEIRIAVPTEGTIDAFGWGARP